MTVRPFVLAIVVVLCQTIGAPAQTAAPRPVRVSDPFAAPAEADQAGRLRQMQEDLAVFRVLLNRSAARYYNFPGGLADLAHTPPSAEGVYLKGQGVIYTWGLPQPATHPVKKAAVVPAENSAWEKALFELRGEKPAVETKPGDTSKRSLSEVFLTLLAENGRHFTQLTGQERITIAVTLRPGQDCTRCHAVGIGRGASTGTMPMGMWSSRRLEPPKPVYPPVTTPTPLGMGTAKAPLAGLPSPRDDEQIDIQIGDLALKQGRHKEAEEAYLRIIQKLREKTGLESDVRRLVLLAEVSSKMAQCALAAGDGDRAKKAIELALKYSQAAVKVAGKQGKEKTEPLPAQLILSATKAQLDQVAGHKITFEEFSKSATVEYRTFDAPAAPEEKKDGMK